MCRGDESVFDLEALQVHSVALNAHVRVQFFMMGIVRMPHAQREECACIRTHSVDMEGRTFSLSHG